MWRLNVSLDAAVKVYIASNMARNYGVRRINNGVSRVELAMVENVMAPPHGSDGAPYELCTASREEWNRYVQSEAQLLKSRRMAWWDDRVFIVELSSSLHEGPVLGVERALIEATGTGRSHLKHRGSAYIGYHANWPDEIKDLIALLEPDDCFGPCPYLPGSVLPPGFYWSDFHTLIVEVGVCRGWGHCRQEQGQAGPRRLATLSEKADAWRHCPGVAYVFCIRISRSLRVCEYRLYSIVDGHFEDPDMEHAPIEVNTVVQFDARRLLGIPPGTPLPVGFNDPVQINLFDIVDPIIQGEKKRRAIKQAAAATAHAAAAAGQPPCRRQRRH
ncbi:hypothetical protein PsorP6_017961 [Peronosclerospora sorghi]|uniref:Uncharacterized protein n=2 Tax=Peronosclerospora sorghi TaxID=230839 RepID=A0ACC0WDA0_9STRA|nr:hypothetical protein PsorP6_017962 [Peronosclerospora sorghi]KAI9916811.1 hypothetical protein PsorP6_017961 [Peronosclerospora sorghi]